MPQQVLLQRFGTDTVRLTRYVRPLERMHSRCCCVLLHRQRFIKTDSKVFNRRFKRNTVSANVCALTVDRLKTRCRANRHNLSLICVQLKLVAIHPEQNIINTCLKYRTEQKGTDQVGRFWTAQCHRRTCDSSIMDRNHI